MNNRPIVTVSLVAAAFMASPVLASWAEAPASQLSQAQSIMGAQASPDVKLGCLYNGGCSSRQLGAAAPVQAQASVSSSGRSLDIRAVSAGSGLDQASVPSPAAASGQQARVGFWDSGTEGVSNTAIAIGVVVIIAAGIVVASNSHHAAPASSGSASSNATTGTYNQGYQDGYNAAAASSSSYYNNGQNQGYTAGLQSNSNYISGFNAGANDLAIAEARPFRTGGNRL